MASAHDRQVAVAVTAAAFGALCYGAWQNAHGAPGDEISAAQVVWLGYLVAIACVAPAALWRDARLDPAVRRVCGWTLASVAARAIAQAVLSRQGTWAPEIGAAHDIATLALIALLRRGTGGEEATVPDRSALAILTLLQATLLIDAAMAWAADPALDLLRWLGAAAGYPILLFRLCRIGANARALAAVADGRV